MSGRIYGEKKDISEQDVKAFYNKRAAMASKMSSPYSAVLNGDQNPTHADLLNRFDREYIIPKLGITRDTAVLDIGCGIGRIAGMVTPLCGRYLGADFAPEMITVARKTVAGLNENAEFICASFKELMDKPVESFNGKFSCVFMRGVCMYINDDELKYCMSRLPDLLAEHCTMYVGDPVGIGKRLTLDEIHSEQLNSDYSAIYRTQEEYTEFYKPFIDRGFRFVESTFFPPEVNGAKYSDTDRWYAILER